MRAVSQLSSGRLRRLLLAGAAAALGVLAACTGTISGSRPAEPGTRPPGDKTPGAPGVTPGPAGPGATKDPPSPGVDTPAPMAGCKSVDPGPSPMRRLSNVE